MQTISETKRTYAVNWAKSSGIARALRIATCKTWTDRSFGAQATTKMPARINRGTIILIRNRKGVGTPSHRITPCTIIDELSHEEWLWSAASLTSR